MIASLPMYLTPLTAAAYDRLWQAIRNHLTEAGIAAPARLMDNIPDHMAHWSAPDLLLSQTCGLPYRALLKDRVTLVGVPDFGLPDCPPGYYNSVLITRADDPVAELSALADRRFAYNEALSQSGWASVALSVPDILGGPKMMTGSHRASARAVRDGQADFAAIDAQTWRQMGDLGETDGLRVLHRTAPMPGLPLITRQAVLVPALQAAVDHGISTLGAEDRDALGLRGLIRLSPAAYDLPIPPMPEAFSA